MRCCDWIGNLIVNDGKKIGNLIRGMRNDWYWNRTLHDCLILEGKSYWLRLLLRHYTYNSIRTESFVTSIQRITYQFLYCRPLLHYLTQVLITHIPITSYSPSLFTIHIIFEFIPYKATPILKLLSTKEATFIQLLNNRNSTCCKHPHNPSNKLLFLQTQYPVSYTTTTVPNSNIPQSLFNHPQSSTKQNGYKEVSTFLCYRILSIFRKDNSLKNERNFCSFICGI